jgi:hypothetical protein
MGGSARGEDGVGRENGRSAHKPSPHRREWLASQLRRHEVVTLSALRSVGYSYDEVRGMVDRGTLRRLHRGVFASAHHRLTRHAELKAALLAAGPTAFLSHTTAAELRKLRRNRNEPIHVTVVANRTPRIRGVVVHRCRRRPDRLDVTVYDGLRASTPQRILAELAAAGGHSDDDLRRLAGEALRRGGLDLERLPRYLHHRPGATAVTRALTGYLKPPKLGKSKLEASIAAAIARDPRFGPFEQNVYLGDANGIEVEADIVLSEGVVIEADGPQYHLTLEDREDDRRKDAWYSRNGIPFLRITGARWEADPQGCLDDLYAIVVRARATASATADANASTSAAVVSQAHIQRTSPDGSSQT